MWCSLKAGFFSKSFKEEKRIFYHTGPPNHLKDTAKKIDRIRKGIERICGVNKIKGIVVW